MNEQFVINGSGERVAVLLEMKEYQKILEALEELESISAYDEAKAAADEVISFDQAIKELENQRFERSERLKGDRKKTKP